MTKAFYFGTREQTGHVFIPVQGKFTPEERKDWSMSIDSDAFHRQMHRNGYFYHAKRTTTDGESYIFIAIPASADDNRPPSVSFFCAFTGDYDEFFRILFKHPWVVKQLYGACEKSSNWMP